MASEMAGPDPRENSAHLLYIPAGVYFAILPTIVALRIWSRLDRRQRIGIDDWAAVASTALTLVTCAFAICCCIHGMGTHLVHLTREQKLQVFKYFYLMQVSYKFAINMSKASILLLYIRLFGTADWFRYLCLGMLGCVGTYCIVSVIATIFQCTPVIRAIDKSIPGTCIDLARFWFANAGFAISTDIIILLLPVPLVCKLKISRQQKLALIAIFAVGIFVVITSCLRLTTLDVYAKTPDMTYDVVNVMWTIIEPGTAVVCANLPALRPLLARIIPAVRSRISAKGKYGNSSTAPSGIIGSLHDRGDWVELGNSNPGGVQSPIVRHSHSDKSQLDWPLPAQRPRSEESTGDVPRPIDNRANRSVLVSI